ncbi:hypothetical protein GE061_015098 [Apolygus lucorum]|uniref:CHK kinase-like domain-containing protein n=1 Tax=Apolygus lucorum TaxID=248454 RepID=A0A8S9XM35_APOLU|nr:hypothetical protein GE061_015098 [Apolygus lucorum]
MDCSADYLGMGPKFVRTIFNQYFCNRPEIPGKPNQTGTVHVEIIIHPDNSPDVHSEHFTSHTKRVHLRFVSTHGENMDASMIIKTQKKWKNLIQASNYNTLFRTEIKIYSTVLPMMTAVMAQIGVNREALWPVMYGCQSDNLLALQDLTDLGFEVNSMKSGLGADDSLLVVQNIARFHAMSKTLVDLGSVSLPSEKSSEIVVDKIYRTLFEVMCHAMEMDWTAEWLPVAKWIRGRQAGILRTVGQLLRKHDKRFAVVNHGDLWTSNIMFKRSSSDNRATSVRFVDFQLCNVNSFIWDLQFFFWTSVNHKVRATSKRCLLREYQNSLEANLKSLGYGGYIPTFSDVLSESRRVEIAGLVFLLFGAVARSDVPRAMDMDKLMTHSPLEVANKAVFADPRAQEIVGEDLKSLSQLGIIPPIIR